MPTRNKQINQALDLLDLKEGDLLIDLGSGDSRVQIEAANRGIRSIGYELNPLLVLISKTRLFRHRDLARVYWRDYLKVDIPSDAKGIFVFSIQARAEQISGFISSSIEHPTKVVAYATNLDPKFKISSFDALDLYEFKPKARI